MIDTQLNPSVRRSSKKRRNLYHKVSKIGAGGTSNSLFARWSLTDGMLVPLALHGVQADDEHRTEDFDLLASEVQDKTPQDVAAYYPVFRKKWKELSGNELLLAYPHRLTFSTQNTRVSPPASRKVRPSAINDRTSKHYLLRRSAPSVIRCRN